MVLIVCGNSTAPYQLIAPILFQIIEIGVGNLVSNHLNVLLQWGYFYSANIASMIKPYYMIGCGSIHYDIVHDSGENYTVK